MAVSRPTMADVAQVAGVSVPTVSKVLNGRADVSGATRSRVQAAMSSTGYTVRGGVPRERSGIVDILINGVGSPWATEILAGAERAASQQGVTLAVTSTVPEDFSITHWISRLAARRSDGVVFVLSQADHDELAVLSELHTPVVLLDPVGESDPDLATVGTTNWAGGLAATKHLLDLGHRRIGFIGGPPDVQCTQERLEGYAAALRRVGLEPLDELITFGDFTLSGGRNGSTKLLDLPEPPTAIFAGSDVQAAGVYQVAGERGLGIPHDLSVVGFDDTNICVCMSPPLTTVRQPLGEMAAEAIRIILDAYADTRSGSGRRVELATSLIERESTAELN